MSKKEKNIYANYLVLIGLFSSLTSAMHFIENNYNESTVTLLQKIKNSNIYQAQRAATITVKEYSPLLNKKQSN